MKTISSTWHRSACQGTLTLWLYGSKVIKIPVYPKLSCWKHLANYEILHHLLETGIMTASVNLSHSTLRVNIIFHAESSVDLASGWSTTVYRSISTYLRHQLVPYTCDGHRLTKLPRSLHPSNDPPT